MNYEKDVIDSKIQKLEEVRNEKGNLIYRGEFSENRYTGMGQFFGEDGGMIFKGEFHDGVAVVTETREEHVNNTTNSSRFSVAMFSMILVIFLMSTLTLGVVSGVAIQYVKAHSISRELLTVGKTTFSLRNDGVIEVVSGDFTASNLERILTSVLGTSGNYGDSNATEAVDSKIKSLGNLGNLGKIIALTSLAVIGVLSMSLVKPSIKTRTKTNQMKNFKIEKSIKVKVIVSLLVIALFISVGLLISSGTKSKSTPVTVVPKENVTEETKPVEKAQETKTPKDDGKWFDSNATYEYGMSAKGIESKYTDDIKKEIKYMCPDLIQISYENTFRFDEKVYARRDENNKRVMYFDMHDRNSDLAHVVKVTSLYCEFIDPSTIKYGLTERHSAKSLLCYTGNTFAKVIVEFIK